MFTSVYLSATMFVATAFFLNGQRLRLVQIVFVWIVVVGMDEVYYTLMLMNWGMYDVSGRVADTVVRLINLNVVTPIIVLYGLDRVVSLQRTAARLLIGWTASVVLFGSDWILIRSDVIKTSPDFHWLMLYAEELFLVVCGYVSLRFISSLMRKDGIFHA